MSYYLVWIDADPGDVTPSIGQQEGQQAHDNSLSEVLWALVERAASSHIFPVEDNGRCLAVIVQDDAP